MDFVLPLLISFCRVLRVCDIALRSAIDSGTKGTDEANARFAEAIRVLSSYSETMRFKSGAKLST